MMKVIVFSCKYTKLLPYFAKQFNKYYHPSVEVIVLSPRPADDMPNNFDSYQLPGYSLNWCNDLMPFFEAFEDEYFLACMEDHFLFSPVNQSVIEDGVKFMEKGLIDKLGFQIGKRSGYKLFEHDPKYHQLTPECNLVSSLQPSIWRTDLFRWCLENARDKDAWAFEEVNKLAFLPTEYTCIYMEQPEPWPVCDVVRRRRPNKAFWEQYVTDPEDLEVFEQATAELFTY